jgi:uncharacterized protein
MKKKSFVLSWGRKMFFGLGWALTSIVALNYFQSMILPQSFSGWIYYLTTFVGHYGLMLSLIYFLVYCPVVILFPTYYVSRIWSITLLIAVNFFIFIDSYLFATYRFHANSFLAKFLRDDLAAFGFTPAKWTILAVIILIVMIVLWMRGEKIWRSMQARFSNPVKNWYLVLIFICLGISHSMHMYNDAKGLHSLQRLSQLFPLHFPLTGRGMLKEQGMLPDQKAVSKLGYKDFYYPSKTLKCDIKQPKNILLIVIENWSGVLSETDTPQLYHYRNHGLNFENHYSGGETPTDGLFSLLYSLPPVYLPSVYHSGDEPVFLSLLKGAHFEMDFFSSHQNSPLKQWLNVEEKPLSNIPSELPAKDELAAVNPFFMYVYLNAQNDIENDTSIGMILENFHRLGLISNSIIMITGSTGKVSSTNADKFKTNLMLFWPGSESGSITHHTSHYDLMPTIMQEEWKCKNPLSDYSFGENLLTPHKNNFHVAGNYGDLSIINLKNLSVVGIDEYSRLKVQHVPNMTPGPEKLNAGEVLNVLEKITLFYRRR